MTITITDETEPNKAFISEHSEYAGIYQIAFRPITRVYMCMMCGLQSGEYQICSRCEDPNGGDNNEYED